MRVDWTQVKFPIKTLAFAMQFKFETAEEASSYLGGAKFNGWIDSVGRGADRLWFPTKQLVTKIWGAGR